MTPKAADQRVSDTPRTRMLVLIRDHEYSIREYETHAPGFRAQTEREMNETREHILDFVERELIAALRELRDLRVERDALQAKLQEARELLEYQPDFDYDGEQKMDEWNARRDIFLAAQERKL